MQCIWDSTYLCGWITTWVKLELGLQHESLLNPCTTWPLHCTWLERFQHTHMYSRIQTIAVQYHTNRGPDKHLECLVYVLCLTDTNFFLFVKNKYMFVTGNLKITRKQKRSKHYTLSYLPRWSQVLYSMYFLLMFLHIFKQNWGHLVQTILQTAFPR